MRILVLEDSAVGEYMAEELTRRGHRVYLARDASGADRVIAANGVACLIVDLNLPTTGLTKDERNATHGAILTGWVWLQRVLGAHPALAERTIIYSNYLDELRAHVTDLPAGLTLLPKRGTPSSVAVLLDQVHVISQLDDGGGP